MNKGGQVVEGKAGIAYPFNVAEDEATCPNGHPVKLSTGYSVSAPSWWMQFGVCQICKRSVERTVGMPHSQFAAGPIHWAGEETEEEANWKHDVLNEHRCERCRELAQVELVQTLLGEIEGGAGLAKVVSLLEELTG